MGQFLSDFTAEGAENAEKKNKTTTEELYLFRSFLFSAFSAPSAVKSSQINNHQCHVIVSQALAIASLFDPSGKSILRRRFSQQTIDVVGGTLLLFVAAQHPFGQRVGH